MLARCRMARKSEIAAWKAEVQAAKDRYTLHRDEWRRAVKRDDAVHMKRHWDASQQAWRDYQILKRKPPR